MPKSKKRPVEIAHWETSGEQGWLQEHQLWIHREQFVTTRQRWSQVNITYLCAPRRRQLEKRELNVLKCWWGKVQSPGFITIVWYSYKCSDSVSFLIKWLSHCKSSKLLQIQVKNQKCSLKIHSFDVMWITTQRKKKIKIKKRSRPRSVCCLI